MPLGFLSDEAYFTNVNGTLFFRVGENLSATELWKSDGTSSGTQLVKNIYPNLHTDGSYPYSLTNIGGTLYFAANGGRQVWNSDGTSSGTQLVGSIYNYGYQGSEPHDFVNANGSVILFDAETDFSGAELWGTSGTSSGVQMVKNIDTNDRFIPNHTFYPGSSSPSDLTNLNGVVYFAANNQTSGNELYRSDGTTSGTYLVANIALGGQHRRVWLLWLLFQSDQPDRRGGHIFFRGQ